MTKCENCKARTGYYKRSEVDENGNKKITLFCVSCDCQLKTIQRAQQDFIFEGNIHVRVSAESQDKIIGFISDVLKVKQIAM